MGTRKAIFLDRDGVINKEINYLYRIKDFELIDGVIPALQFFKKLGFLLIVITNQAGVGRGYYTENDVIKLHHYMENIFSENECAVDRVYYCPHGPNDNCECRKPKPGMIVQAVKEFDIDLNESWLIGDKNTDLLAGKNAGVKNLVLVRSGHIVNEEEPLAHYIFDSIYNVIDMLS